MNTPPRQIWLHVGVPKTGTSQIQDMLFLNRASLHEEHGVLYPSDSHDDHFLAALDLIGQEWGGLEKRAVGAWDRLVQRINDHDGTAVISHEVFAAASREQALRALDELDGEVHVVVSARDLHRQIPAEWQEGVKHRRRTTYAEFCHDLVSQEPSLQSTRWFWRVQDVPRVVERWASGLPPEQIHVLTVPDGQAPRDLLIDRFLGLFGIDREWLPEVSDRSNASLGAPETTVIRRLNEMLPPGRLGGDVYRFHVRELLVHRTLAQRSGPRITLPESITRWADSTVAAWVSEIEAAGYDVVGDLAELRPPPASDEWYDPDGAPVSDQLDVTYAALEALLLEIGHLDVELRQRRAEAAEVVALRAQVHALRAQVHALTRPGPWMRTKQRFVAFSAEHAVARALLRVWRFVRRR